MPVVGQDSHLHAMVVLGGDEEGLMTEAQSQSCKGPTLDFASPTTICKPGFPSCICLL